MKSNTPKGLRISAQGCAGQRSSGATLGNRPRKSSNPERVASSCPPNCACPLCSPPRCAKNVTIEWRAASQWKDLPASDLSWTAFCTLLGSVRSKSKEGPIAEALTVLRAIKRDRTNRLFEFRLSPKTTLTKPLPTLQHSGTPLLQHSERLCINCGCTDSSPCKGGCSWIMELPTIRGLKLGLCSNCGKPFIDTLVEAINQADTPIVLTAKGIAYAKRLRAHPKSSHSRSLASIRG